MAKFTTIMDYRNQEVTVNVEQIQYFNKFLPTADEVKSDKDLAKPNSFVKLTFQGGDELIVLGTPADVRVYVAGAK